MKNILGNLGNVDVMTWTRLVLLLLGLVNMVLNMAGMKTLPFTDDQVSELVASVYTIVMSGVVYYFNNNHTPEAQRAQGKLNEYKARTNHANNTGAAIDQEALQTSHEIPEDYYKGNI